MSLEAKPYLSSYVDGAAVTRLIKAFLFAEACHPIATITAMANFKASTLGRTAVTAAVRVARLFASAIAPWSDVDKCYYYIAAYTKLLY